MEREEEERTERRGERVVVVVALMGKKNGRPTEKKKKQGACDPRPGAHTTAWASHVGGHLTAWPRHPRRVVGQKKAGRPGARVVWGPLRCPAPHFRPRAPLAAGAARLSPGRAPGTPAPLRSPRPSHPLSSAARMHPL